MKTACRLLALAAALAGGAAIADVALLEASRSGDTAAALALVDDGADVRSSDNSGTTALHWAAHHDNAELAQRLIQAGADVSAANAYGATPLSEAATVGNAEMIGALIAAGVDVDAANADGQTALMIVARSSNVDAARLLIEHGADVNAKESWRGQTALMWAAAQRQPEMTALLIDNGAELDARSNLNQWERQVSVEPRAQWRPPGGWSALAYAARQGCVECARVLLEAGADADLGNEEGMTALLIAVMNLHFDVAAVLIEGGANPDKWDWRGRSPLYAAVDMNTLPHGGRPDRPSVDDATSLDIIEQLLEAGANPDLQLKLNPLWRSIQDDRGKDLLLSIGATPLLRAAKAFDAPAIRLLLEHGANVHLPNDGEITRTQIGGITPLMAAAGLGSRPSDSRGEYETPDVQARSIRALELLLAAGADINATDDHGRTALHGAASWGWTETVRFLAERGADLHAADADGVTPYDAAMGNMEGGRRGGGNVPAHVETVDLLEALMAGSATAASKGGAP